MLRPQVAVAFAFTPPARFTCCRAAEFMMAFAAASWMPCREAFNRESEAPLTSRTVNSPVSIPPRMPACRSRTRRCRRSVDSVLQCL